MPRWIALVGTLLALTLLSTTIAAQEATPSPTSAAPAPEECRVAPRSPEELVAVLFAPAAPPATPVAGLPAPGEERAVASEAEFPRGEPADAVTAAAVAAVVRESVACVNAGNDFRSLALLSDALLRTAFGALEVYTPAELAAELAAELTGGPTTPAVPLPEGERRAIFALRDARVFADGRVGVVAITGRVADDEDRRVRLIILANREGRWLFDNVMLVVPDAARA